MKQISVSLIACSLAFVSANAARPDAGKPAAKEQAKPVASPAAGPQAETVTIELKNKSVFEVPGATRDPFWPIGWKPVAKATESSSDHSGGDIPLNAFLVTSITVESSGHFAIINGKVMQEGQQFGLQMGNQTYQITVKSIRDGGVVLARRDQEIVVPLRRK